MINRTFFLCALAANAASAGAAAANQLSPFPPPAINPVCLFFLEYFHGNEPLVLFYQNIIAQCVYWLATVCLSDPSIPSASPLCPQKPCCFIFFFLSHLSDFQPLAQYSPPSATKRAEHTESSLIRAFSPSLRLPPSGNRFARGLAEGRATSALLRCSSSTAEEQTGVLCSRCAK